MHTTDEVIQKSKKKEGFVYFFSFLVYYYIFPATYIQKCISNRSWVKLRNDYRELINHHFRKIGSSKIAEEYVIKMKLTEFPRRPLTCISLI